MSNDADRKKTMPLPAQGGAHGTPTLFGTFVSFMIENEAHPGVFLARVMLGQEGAEGRKVTNRQMEAAKALLPYTLPRALVVHNPVSGSMSHEAALDLLDGLDGLDGAHDGALDVRGRVSEHDAAIIDAEGWTDADAGSHDD